ncbi:hypothetical protein ASPVEDRAFT_56791 [Aspergillus versicolor CBS 583.65]|uniref:ABM domain-containing protein n=1 Tax=Aspergillus versicolor CBS 583.65 TaxID=1036611 RepID=A0A1L9Q0V8_ASPVE|nr:uncharacterized protein ASPVEDRAFT_56791 [Aspergillus versicolor CBS 583.65]OJJ07393.1 hypothetical protein ASPVEDRAFT_56791 [Aspergillus versicolor CBS 583.65]
MPVTEIACLRLKNTLPLTDPSNETFYTRLQDGIKAQAEYTNARTHILTQLEDPSYFYILGRWESLSQHVEEWIPAPKNQDIMAGLAEGIELVWIQHLDLDPNPSAAEDGYVIPYNAAVTGIGRCFISPGCKDGFDKTFAATRHYVKDFKGPREAVGAWRVDREVDEQGNPKDEFVYFSGWANIHEHEEFRESEGFKEFGKLKQYIETMHVKHAKWEFTA